MVRSSWYILFLLIGEAICYGMKPYKISFVSVSAFPKNGLWDVSKVRLVGRDRLVNGTFTLKEDMDDEHYSFSYNTDSDPSGDGNYKLLPFNIPRTSICETYKKYRKYIYLNGEFGRETDFPIDRDVCPIPKGTYYLKNVTLSTDNWPSIIPRGFQRLNGSFYRNDELVSTCSLMILVEDVAFG